MPELMTISRSDLVALVQALGLDPRDVIHLDISSGRIVAEVLDRDNNGDLIVNTGRIVRRYQTYEVVNP